MTEKVRVDRWVRKPESPEQLVEFLGKHLVAYPFGDAEERAGGQFIGMDTGARTASLRRYDTGAIREFPWLTTDFRYTTEIECPFTDLKPGSVRRFEWFHGDDGQPVTEPISLVGTVDLVKPGSVHLWVRDHRYSAGGWWASLKAEDAARHAVRPVNLKQDRP